MRLEVRLADPADADEIEIVDISAAVDSRVAEGEVLLEVATDKANVELVAPEAGTVEEVLVAVGDVISPDQVLVVLRTS
jgi:pyruvate/2-oxoglutarate dehydrogenase complex dihydrolipoamide acyltransferase (E2) component